MASNVVQGSTRLILIGAAVLLSVGMGLRQSLGLFLTPLTRDLALTAVGFTLTIAIQNIVWEYRKRRSARSPTALGCASRWWRGLPFISPGSQLPPWEGHEVAAWPSMTILRGKIVVENRRFLGGLGDGEFLPRKIPDEIRARPAV